MKIVITGATGFIGHHLVAALVQQGHKPLAVGRDRTKLASLVTTHGIETAPVDLNSSEKNWFLALGEPDIVLHLAWGGLNDFSSLSHLEEELPLHCRFLKNLVVNGAKRLVVAGTCFEYGLQDGPLSETTSAAPQISYAVAKDTLRRYLTILQQEQNSFTMLWLRYFYMYGEGQSKKALLSQLDAAIACGDASFNMSGGEQLRDYLPATEVARLTALLATMPTATGIFNICSGQPISIRNVVEKRVLEQDSTIILNFGHYPYPTYEPMAFWGDRRKIDHILALEGVI